MKDVFVHETAVVDDGVTIGDGTKVWHFSHIMDKTVLGEKCSVGQNVVIGPDVSVGNHVKIQNNVSVYKGVTLEDYVFCGPSMVFTNVYNPRSEIPRMEEVRQTVVKRGASLCANCTIVCGVTIGRYAFVAAGAVVTRDVPDYGLVVGVPGRQVGWMSRHGVMLPEADEKNIMTCKDSGLRYKEMPPGVVRCIDVDEEAELEIGN
ncbi:N-acetyltransferase [bacterium E08(2017)]|nr:N-acetyltransferase [bacterium E08(2017)]